MKKVIVAVLLLALLCGCGSGEKAPVVTDTPSAQPTEAPTASPAPTAEPSAEPVKETVIVDNDALTFTIKGTTVDSYGYHINVLLENKTDKNVLVVWEDVSVDDFMNDTYWSEYIKAGKKAPSEILFYNLSDPGIFEFTLLMMPEISENVYDRESAFIDEVYSFEP